MSVTEIAQRGEEFERTPPHDLAAEQCVLGGMLLSKDAISDVLEVIRPADHYRPAHQLVHEVILDLYGRGEPADAVTVAAELTKRGDIARVGGAPYLHTLIASVPTAANAGYYARIVRERSILRRLVEVGTRIVQLGYSGDGDADELVDRAEAEVYGVTERRVSDDYLPLSEIMPGALDEIEAIGSRGGGLTGVPTGFADLDALTNGLHPGQMIVIAARPALGKALALDTPLPTPDGWTTMGDVAAGDYLIGADGKPARVLAVTDVMHDRPCFEVEFNDGSILVADAEHQWRTTTRAARRQRPESHQGFYWPETARKRLRDARSAALQQPDCPVTAAEVLSLVGPEFGVTLHRADREVGFAPERIAVRAKGPQRSYMWRAPTYSSRHSLLARMAERADRPVNAATTRVHDDVKTTAQIAATVRLQDGRMNHAVPVAQPAVLPPADLPFPPYTLGAWLGDGTSASAQLTSNDPEIIAEIEAEGFTVVKAEAARMRYSIRLPRRENSGERPCAVCGNSFLPKTSQVRTCGRVCGGRSKSAAWRPVLGPSPQPKCPDCGRPSSGTGLCRVCWNHHGTAQAMLRTLGVLGDKHIPAQYLRASEVQRRALLAGLLDTDGYIAKNGTVQFAVTSRRLAEDTWELVLSLGYRASMTTKPVQGRSEESSTCYMVTFTPAEKVFRLARKLSRQSTREYPTTRCRFISAVRPIASVPVRCVQVDNDDQMYLAGRTWIPTHNSTLALDLARAASIKNGLTSAIFSLEMSRNEITMRLLSAEARVPLHSMRTGQLGDEDWTRLARRMSEVVDAPLFIDDSPNMSMMEIRAKCRRMKQRHDLKLVIIDYLQLMSSPKRVENRQQEVSEMSRSLKLLAKELEVPVIAVAQLNRGPEQRTDKRPMLSDLRESGCLTAGTRILRADTGAEVTLGELIASGERDIPVWSLDERLRMSAQLMTHAFPSGVKEVFRVRLRSGREVEATANHPFLTYEGWRPLGELAPGSRVAVPRRVPAPASATPLPDPEIVLLGHLIGDGHEKFVPQPVFSLSDQQLALFIRHLWATDGCVWWDAERGMARVYYASTSRRLIDDLAQLLLRFNIMTRVKETRKADYRPCFHLLINGAENQLRFLDSIGVHGNRSIAAGVCAGMLRSVQGNVNLDTVPSEVWTRVREVLQERHVTHRQFAGALGTQFCGSTLWRHAPSRPRLARVASILDDADLEMLATNDVFWDEIASVDSIGEQPVYDATVPGTSNFIANGIALHNSIEQDADVVLLLHREDAYERESPRAGEADFIVAKHRNGPTATVTVAFQGHYSRFVDMAPV